jgi:hypothetical protein
MSVTVCAMQIWMLVIFTGGAAAQVRKPELRPPAVSLTDADRLVKTALVGQKVGTTKLPGFQLELMSKSIDPTSIRIR